MVGIGAATTDKDSIVTSYRDHCTHLTKGGTLLEVMAELLGRIDGASKGYGGSMHMYRKASCLCLFNACRELESHTQCSHAHVNCWLAMVQRDGTATSRILQHADSTGVPAA